MELALPLKCLCQFYRVGKKTCRLMSKPNSPPKQNVCEDRHNQKVMKAAKKNGDSLICLWSYEKSERSAKLPPKVCEQCEKNTNKVCGDDGKTREIEIDTIFERTTHKKGAKTKKTNETEMVPMKPPKTDVVAMENFSTNTTKRHSTEAKSKKGAHKKHNKMDAIKISASTTNLRQIKPQYEIPLKKTSHAHKSTKKYQKIDDRELICYYKNESNLVSDASSKNVYFDGECSYQTPKIICKCFVDESSELHIKNTCHKDPSNKLIDVEVINTTFGTTTKISDEFIDCRNATTKLKSLIPKPIENLDYKIECCLKRFPELYQNQDLCGMDVDLHQGSWSDVHNTREGDLCGFNTTICSDDTSDETSTENLVQLNPGYQPLRKLYEQKYGSMNAIKEQIESVNEEISNMIKSALFKIETKSNYCCLNADISDTSDDEVVVPNFSTHQNSPLGHHRSVSTLKRKSTEDVTVPKKKFKEDSPIFRLLENALEVYQEQERAKSEASGNTPENLMVRQMFSMLSHMEVLLEEYFHGGGGYAHATLVCGCDKRFTCDKSSQTAIAERFKPKSRYTIQTYTVFCSALSSAETQTLNQTQTQRLVEAKSSIFGRLKKKFIAKTKSDQALTEDTKCEMVENETQTDPKTGKFFGKIRTAVKFLSKKHSKTRQPDDTKMLSPMPSTSGSVFSTNKITQTYLTTDTNIEEGFIKTVDLTEDADDTKRTKNSGHKKDTFGSSDLVELHHTHNTDGGLTPMGSLGVLSEDTTLTVPYQKTNPEPALKHLAKPPKKASVSKTKKNVKKKKRGKELGQNEEFGMETIEGDLGRFDEESLDYNTLSGDFELKQLKMRKLVEKVHDMDRYYYKIALPKVGGDENMGQKKLEDGTIELSLDNVNLEEFDLEFSGLDKKSATKSACTSTCVNTKDVVVEAHVDTTDVGTHPPKSPPKRDNYTQFEGCTSVCIDTTHTSSLDLVPSLNSDAKNKRTTTHDYLVQNTPTLLKQAGHTHNTPLLRLRLDSNTKIEKGTKISIPSDESRNKFKCFNFDGFIGNRRDVVENHTQLTHTTAHNCSIPNTLPKVQTQPSPPPPPEENLSNYYIVYMPEKPSEGESRKNSAADFKIWYYFQNMPKSIPEIKSTTTLPNSTSTTTTNDTTSSSIFQKILLLKKHSNTCLSGDDDYVGRGDGYKIPNTTSIDGDNLNKPKRVVGVQYVTLPMVISDGEEIHRDRRRTSQNCF